MKTAIIYQSHYGSTEKYAKWLAEDLDADLLQASKVKTAELEKYKMIVYGGGLYAGGVNGIALLIKNFEHIQDKEIYLFTVGIADTTNFKNIQAIRKALQQKLSPIMWEKIHIYHMRGGMYYSKMKFLHRIMMKMMIKMLRKKPEDELTEEDKSMLNNVNQDIDFTDRKMIERMVADIKAISIG